MQHSVAFKGETIGVFKAQRLLSNGKGPLNGELSETEQDALRIGIL
jgi:hypothetical protein